MGILTDILKEFPVSSVLRERIMLLQGQFDELGKRVKELEDENAQLKNEVDQLQDRLACLRAEEEFQECHGAFFKRKPGGYHLAVYCPYCHVSTYSFEQHFPFECPKCKWKANFNGKQLDEVMEDLPRMTI